MLELENKQFSLTNKVLFTWNRTVVEIEKPCLLKIREALKIHNFLLSIFD